MSINFDLENQKVIKADKKDFFVDLTLCLPSPYLPFKERYLPITSQVIQIHALCNRHQRFFGAAPSA
jgi:hypothetical protein